MVCIATVKMTKPANVFSIDRLLINQRKGAS